MLSKEKFAELSLKIHSLPSYLQEEARSYLANIVGAQKLPGEFFYLNDQEIFYSINTRGDEIDYFFKLIRSIAKLLDIRSQPNFLLLLKTLNVDKILRVVVVKRLKISRKLSFYKSGSDYCQIMKKIAEINHKLLLDILDQRKDVVTDSNLNVYDVIIIKNYLEDILISEIKLGKNNNNKPYEFKFNYTQRTVDERGIGVLEFNNPRTLSFIGSFFYDENPPSKHNISALIVLALKKDFRLSSERSFLSSDFEIRAHVKYLLNKIGFVDREIPAFEQIPDTVNILEEYEIESKDLEKNYHFLWVNLHPASVFWKLCDFLFIRKDTYRVEKFYSERLNLVEDNLLFICGEWDLHDW